MVIELYASGAPHPPLVEAYIDLQGNLWGMEPPPHYNFDDLMQVVLEQGDVCPNRQQKEAIHFLIQMNGATSAYLFRKSEAPTRFQSYVVQNYF